MDNYLDSKIKQIFCYYLVKIDNKYLIVNIIELKLA